LEVIGVGGVTKVHFWFLSISGAPLSFFFTKRSTKKIKKWGNLIPHFELVSFVLKFDFCGPFRNQIIIFFFHKEIFEEKIKFLELRLGEGLRSFEIVNKIDLLVEVVHFHSPLVEPPYPLFMIKGQQKRAGPFEPALYA
jgi:hypothetical protein